MMPRPPSSPLFPYTTLFRSNAAISSSVGIDDGRVVELHGTGSTLAAGASVNLNPNSTGNAAAGILSNRSEANPSDIQSRQYLVTQHLLGTHNDASAHFDTAA